MKYAPWRERGAEQTMQPTGASLKLLRKLHQTIAKITQDFEGRWHFNTCIAAIMEFVNELQAADAQLAAGEMCRAPVVHETAAQRWCCCWRRLRRTWRRSCGRSLAGRAQFSAHPWPQSDPELAKEDEMEIPVQINGKLVTVVRVAGGCGCEDD